MYKLLDYKLNVPIIRKITHYIQNFVYSKRGQLKKYLEQKYQNVMNERYKNALKITFAQYPFWDLKNIIIIIQINNK